MHVACIALRLYEHHHVCDCGRHMCFCMATSCRPRVVCITHEMCVFVLCMHAQAKDWPVHVICVLVRTALGRIFTAVCKYVIFISICEQDINVCFMCIKRYTPGIRHRTGKKRTRVKCTILFMNIESTCEKDIDLGHT